MTDCPDFQYRVKITVCLPGSAPRQIKGWIYRIKDSHFLKNNAQTRNINNTSSLHIVKDYSSSKTFYQYSLKWSTTGPITNMGYQWHGCVWPYFCQDACVRRVGDHSCLYFSFHCDLFVAYDLLSVYNKIVSLWKFLNFNLLWEWKKSFSFFILTSVNIKYVYLLLNYVE